MITAEQFQSREDTVHQHLKPRQVEVLRLVARGLINKQIGRALNIGERTVQDHVSHILENLQVETRMQAALKGIELGVVSLKEATEGLNVDSIFSLNDRDRELLEISTTNHGTDSSISHTAARSILSDHTVKSYRERIFKITGAKNIVQAGLLYLYAKERLNADLDKANKGESVIIYESQTTLPATAK